MKKILSIALSISLIISCFAMFGITANAYYDGEGKTEDYKYRYVIPEPAWITDYIGSDQYIAIPEKLDGRKVRSIDAKAFSGDKKLNGENNKKIKRVILNENIDGICTDAFKNCVSLTMVYLPKNVEGFTSVFKGCKNLKDIYYGGSKSDWKRNVGDIGQGNAKIHYNATMPTILTDVKKGKKSFTATYSKATSIGGYQIQYSTGSKFAKNYTKTRSISKSKTKFTVKNLKGGKKYYVRVRTYKTVKGKKHYSPWSNFKTVKTGK